MVSCIQCNRMNVQTTIFLNRSQHILVSGVGERDVRHYSRLAVCESASLCHWYDLDIHI